MKTSIAFAVLPFFILPCYAEHSAGSRLYLQSIDSTETYIPADSTQSMTTKRIVLDAAVVNGNSSKKDIQMRSSLNIEKVSGQYMQDNFGASLMQSLSKIPGIKSMSVGSGESKPIIRGLGFNRILVAENGIKHEGQQWGDDHGLETDQYSIDAIDVIKGPSALSYGSDAIGGVINLQSITSPQTSFGGKVNIFARSNNESVGTSAKIYGRNGGLWYKANATFIDYADYRVPADSIPYYSYYIKLHDRRLRNTAGREADGALVLGYDGDGWNTSLRLSDVNTRSGFFADAHGLEVRLSDIDYDTSRRDLDLPYHTANHLFVSNHTEWHWEGGMIEGNIGWQNNRQQEFSEPVSHGYMPKPADSLERSFIKNTVSASMHVRHTFGKSTLYIGTNVEYQSNRRGGWGFILPAFRQLQFGFYASDRLAINDKFILSAGIRYDHGTVDISSYKDWYKTPDENGDLTYMERSENMFKAFDSFIWSAGINRNFGDFTLKANIGKSFRMPIAKELGMDGINYSIFRYEKGNSRLQPEESYQADAGIFYERKTFSASITPYMNYFPNYIYLNPTDNYREGLQLYYYTQSRVFRWGFEAEFSYSFCKNFELKASGEYLHARQLSGEKKGYSLPFSTPWSARTELRYTLPSMGQRQPWFIAMEYVIVGRQDEIVPPEEPTPGYRLLNASAGKSFQIGDNVLRLTLRCDNVLGTKYYDHTSYYRLIGVPELGRNVSLMAAWNF